MISHQLAVPQLVSSQEDEEEVVYQGTIESNNFWALPSFKLHNTAAETQNLLQSLA